MKTFLLSSMGCLLLFYSLYVIFFKRLSFYKWNRFYLLATLLLSLSIPFLRFGETNYIPAGVSIRTTIEQANTAAVITAPATQVFNWLAIAYWIGVCFMAGFFIISAIKLYKKIKNNKQEELNGLTIIRTKDLNASFFRFIFLQQNLDPGEEKIIFQHERVHQQQLHSLDNLFIAVIKICCWFNPLVYIYGRLLKSVHELEADQLMTSQMEKTDYAQLLLKFNAGKESGLLNLYSVHPLKHRIHSLFTHKTNNMKKALYLLILPCLALAISSFSFITTNRLPTGILIKSDSTELTMQISLRQLLGSNASWAAFENFEAGTFEKVQKMFKEQGYDLTVTEKVQGDNETIKLLGFGLTGNRGAVKATYRVNEMISNNYYLMISLNKEKQEVRVNSSETAFLK